MNSEGIDGEAGNENTSENDSIESQDKENLSEKWDLDEKQNTANALDVSTNSSVQKKCKNCGHTIQQYQMFCDKCGNQLGAVCCGEINEKPCSKFISVETNFCAHCGTANIFKNSVRNNDPPKRSCKSCGHHIHKAQNFCNNCGYKIGAPCLGKINRNPCTKFLNVEIKFCGNCGTANPDHLAEQLKSQNKDEISSILSNDSIMQLVSKEFTREESIDAWKCYRENIKDAVDWLLSLPTDDDTLSRIKPSTDDVILQRRTSPNDDDILKRRTPPIDDCKLKKTKRPNDANILKRRTPPNDDETLKKTTPTAVDNAPKSRKSPIDDDTLTIMKQPPDDDTLTRTKPPPDDDTLARTIPPTRTRQPNDNDAKTSTNPPTDDDQLTRTKPPPDDDTLARTKPPTRTRQPTDNDAKTRKKPPPDDDILTKTKRQNGDDTLARTKPPTDNDTMKRTKPRTDNDTMKRTKPTTYKDTLTRKKPLTDDDTLKRTKPLTDKGTMTGMKPASSGETEFQELYSRYKEDGIVKTTLYVRKKLNEVKTGIIKFAVIGRSGVGKSSFINLMLDLQKGSDNYAETGFGDTTKKMTEYKHPKNKNITFCDMPGFGTIEMTTERFTSEFGPQLPTFDYFFIFLDTVIMEEDLWLVKHLQDYGTPYCMVRSKIDEDVKKERTKEEIRQKLKRSMEANDIVKGSALFLISNEKSYCHTGDFRELLAHISKHLPEAKAESLAFFLPFLTPEMIEQKFQSLQNRIKYVALSAGCISAIPIPLFDIPFNIWLIGAEIEQYHTVFLLDKDMVKNVPGVKHRTLSKYDIKQILIAFGKAVTNVATIGTVIVSQADILIPGVGSVAAGGSSFVYARKLLNQILIEMKEDASSVYEHYTNVK